MSTVITPPYTDPNSQPTKYKLQKISGMTKELRVSESIAIGLKRVAIILAEDLDYSRAAEKLGLTSVELRQQISALEAQLYFHIFKPRQKKVEVTEEGRFLIKAFRESVALHDRNASKGRDDADQ